MYLRHSAKYGKAIKIIHPGEFYTSQEDELIGTLLGSCIAVCLICRDKGIAGVLQTVGGMRYGSHRFISFVDGPTPPGEPFTAGALLISAIVCASLHPSREMRGRFHRRPRWGWRLARSHGLRAVLGGVGAGLTWAIPK